jgi:endonuclease YncB( thermonuclease family)
MATGEGGRLVAVSRKLLAGMSGNLLRRPLAWRFGLSGRRGLGKGLRALAIAAAAALCVMVYDRMFGPPDRPIFTGAARVVDADTLVVAGERVRLDGLDAPEIAQTCQREGVTWPCGTDAAMALHNHIAGRHVACGVSGRDSYGRMVGQCRTEEGDIGAWLVSEGLALAYTRYSWRYVPEELMARWQRRGMWAGRFERPEEWRRSH